MRFEDLSKADQQLLNTDLGEFDKEASEKVALADEMYHHGFFKMAQEAADSMEATAAAELAASEKVASEEGMDDDSEKVAVDLGQFIERGFFDGLRKLGSERYDDELAYILPFLEEKIAAAGAAAALEKFAGAWEATKKYFGSAAKQVEEGAKSLKATKAFKKNIGVTADNKDYFAGKLKEGRKEYWSGRGKQVAPVAGGAAALGTVGGAYGLGRHAGKKKERKKHED